MNDAIHAFFLTYAALFPIVNPLGTALIFLDMTARCSSQVRHQIAWRVAVSGFVLLGVSVLAGSHILEFFGLSLPAVRIAGGIVISIMGWRLLDSGDGSTDGEIESSKTDQGALAKTFYPITMPMTFGPGSIAVAIALGTQRSNMLHNFDRAVIQDLSICAGLLAICATVYLAYANADVLKRVLGENGTNVLLRLAAFIILCIGIQMIWVGIADLIHPV
ncbi:MarC family protein [Brucella sp. IR073]|uniref:MarC family protein n=1 Tax=unclassified Brucella TaxID=2632610 RepID=UPI003B97DD92